MKKSIEIVTHVYCPPGVPWYAEHLKWQFASLIHNPPKSCKVCWTVCFNWDDQVTVRRLAKCVEKLSEMKSKWLMHKPIEMSLGSLFRRSIGRDQACQRTRCDVVWFTDADYLFGEGCLDAVAEHCDKSSMLHMPQKYWISYQNDSDKASKSVRPHHEQGQEAIDRELLNDFPKIRQSEFAEKTQRIAIGGMQIIGSSFARSTGYLRGIGQWQTPVDPSLGFRSCKCDAFWRRVNRLHAKRIPIPNLYRLRHLDDGRDFTLDGKKAGRKVW